MEVIHSSFSSHSTSLCNPLSCTQPVLIVFADSDGDFILIISIPLPANTHTVYCFLSARHHLSLLALLRSHSS